MFKLLRQSFMLLLVLTVITGVLYPLAATGLSQWMFPHQANGSLIERDGKPIGSALIGQSFTGDKYFHGRPSATLGPDPADPSKTTSVPYNAVNSMGSNLGPTNRALIERVQGDVDKRKQENPSQPVPQGVEPQGRPVDEAPAKEPTPVYKKWWLWTIVSVVVVGGALGVGLGLGLRKPPPFDQTLADFGPGAAKPAAAIVGVHF